MFPAGRLCPAVFDRDCRARRIRHAASGDHVVTKGLPRRSRNRTRTPGLRESVLVEPARHTRFYESAQRLGVQAGGRMKVDSRDGAGDFAQGLGDVAIEADGMFGEACKICPATTSSSPQRRLGPFSAPAPPDYRKIPAFAGMTFRSVSDQTRNIATEAEGRKRGYRLTQARPFRSSARKLSSSYDFLVAFA